MRFATLPEPDAAADTAADPEGGTIPASRGHVAVGIV